jgi:hypothetical protein
MLISGILTLKLTTNYPKLILDTGNAPLKTFDLSTNNCLLEKIPDKISKNRDLL